jgi:dienelactone hydrolase
MTLRRWYVAQTMYAFIPFLYYNSFGAAYPVVKGFMTSVRQNEGRTLPIAVAGFCWGGKHVLNLAHGARTPDGKDLLIDAGFTAHPSFLKIPEEIQKIEQPVSFALPEHDPAIKLAQIKQIEEIVAKQPESYQGEVKVYYAAGHGFAVRAEPDTKNIDEKADEAEAQALDWFNRHLKKR